MAGDAGLIDDGMLAALAAVGSPKEVALDIANRFGGQVDRVSFYPRTSSVRRPWGSWWPSCRTRSDRRTHEPHLVLREPCDAFCSDSVKARR